MYTPISCPVCGGRLCDADSKTRFETRLIGHKSTPHRDDWFPTIYTKCWKCKACVGIRTITE